MLLPLRLLCHGLCSVQRGRWWDVAIGVGRRNLPECWQLLTRWPRTHASQAYFSPSIIIVRRWSGRLAQQAVQRLCRCWCSWCSLEKRQRQRMRGEMETRVAGRVDLYRERVCACVCVSGAVGASQRRGERSPRGRRRLKVAVGARQVKLSRV